MPPLPPRRRPGPGSRPLAPALVLLAALGALAPGAHAGCASEETALDLPGLAGVRRFHHACTGSWGNTDYGHGAQGVAAHAGPARATAGVSHFELHGASGPDAFDYWERTAWFDAEASRLDADGHAALRSGYAEGPGYAYCWSRAAVHAQAFPAAGYDGDAPVPCAWLLRHPPL